MNKYEIMIEDIYDKNKSKSVFVYQSNAFLAHKEGLNYTNALREDIIRITNKGKMVFNIRAGFVDNE
jgi:hypothetical protein